MPQSHLKQSGKLGSQATAGTPDEQFEHLRDPDTDLRKTEVEDSSNKLIDQQTDLTNPILYHYHYYCYCSYCIATTTATAA